MTYASTTYGYDFSTGIEKRIARPMREEPTTVSAISCFILTTFFCGFAATAGTVSTAPVQEVRISDKYVVSTAGNSKKDLDCSCDALDGPMPWVTDISWIREHSGVSVSVLADLFGVTRKAFYSWLDGTATPRGDRPAKIAALRVALELLESRELRSAVLDAVDKPTSYGSIRELLNTAVQIETDMSGLLQNVIMELAPTLGDRIERLGRKTPRSRHIDTDFASA